MLKNLLTQYSLWLIIEIYINISERKISMKIRIQKQKGNNGKVPVYRKSYWQRKVEKQLADINAEITNINNTLRGAIQ